MTATELIPFVGHICTVTTAEAEYTGVAFQIEDGDRLMLLEMVYPHPGLTASQKDQHIPIAAIERISSKEMGLDIGKTEGA